MQRPILDDRAEDRREKVRWAVLLAGVSLAFYLCWLMLQPFVQVLLWALVLTTSFRPLHARVHARVKNRDLSALVSCFIVLLVIGLPTVLVGFAVIRELTPAVETLQSILLGLLDPKSPVTGSVLSWLAERGVDIETVKQQAVEQAQAGLRDLTTNSIGYVRGIVSGIFGIILQTFFIFFTMYYLFRDGDRFRVALISALPLRGRTTNSIFQRIREVIGASVYGVFTIALIQGTLGGLAFWVLGLPSAVVLGVVMTFFSLIPMAGAFLVWIPAAIYLAAIGSWGAALGLTIWGSVVIGLIDNVLRPKLVGERAKLHELFIFFAVLGGLQVFGIVGLFLGPVVLAIALALFDALRQPEATTMTIPPGSVSSRPPAP